MARQLRPRINRPSYATLAGLDSDNEELPPSSPHVRVEVLDNSESELSSSEKPPSDGGMTDDDVQVDELASEEDKEGGMVFDKIKKREHRQPRTRTEPLLKDGQKFLPPNVNSKHRAPPLFSPRDHTERLLRPSSLFKSCETVRTNSSTHSQKVADRVGKAWGYNVGPGPLRDLLEDRAWFKEAYKEDSESSYSADPRPRVYNDIVARDDWEVLEESDAAPYLPSNISSNEDSGRVLFPCYVGPFGAQKKRYFSQFEAIPPSVDGANGHVFNAGSPVWALDWCPIHPSDQSARSFIQYLAVAPFPSYDHSPDIGVKLTRPSPACIQIWSLSSELSSAQRAGFDTDRGKMKCELVLCIDSGPAFEVKWCPLPSHDLVGCGWKVKKLGLLGGTFEDGTFCVYTVPDPSDLRNADTASDDPVYVKLSCPILRIELEETSCWSFDWANSEKVAIGIVAVYNIAAALRGSIDAGSTPISDVYPSHYITAHQSAIRSLAWIRVPPYNPIGQPSLDQDPAMIISGGYDGLESLLDIRQGRSVSMNRTRDVINAVAYSPFTGGPISIDRDNMVKDYSISPVLLGRGHVLCELSGPAWSVHASDYHPQLAVGAADGTCMTTNMFKSHRRITVPVFAHTIFQMDFNRQTQEYRMLDRFLPSEAGERPSTAKTAKGKTKTKAKDPASAGSTSTGAWPLQVGVHRVVWNNGHGLAASGLLATATASGLCRVDNLDGRWSRGQIPYGGVQGIRMESRDKEVDEDAMNVDGEDDDNGIDDAEGEADEE